MYVCISLFKATAFNYLLQKHMDETLEVESKLDHATDYIARVKEINQLKDTVSLFKIKEYELETENKKFKLEIEQLRRLSKVLSYLVHMYV